MMQEESDIYLVKKIQEERDDKALSILIDRHSGIYMDMIRKFGSKSLSATQLNDMLDDKDYQIYQAALSYNEDLSKFSTFLALKTKYICLSNKTTNKKNSRIVNFDDQEFKQEYLGDDPCEDSSKREIMQKVCFLIEGFPDERVKMVFKERYFSSTNGKLKPWKLIAPLVNMSIQGCINLHDKHLKEFRKKIINEQVII
jgi:hypothetical protein